MTSGLCRRGRRATAVGLAASVVCAAFVAAPIQAVALSYSTPVTTTTVSAVAGITAVGTVVCAGPASCEAVGISASAEGAVFPITAGVPGTAQVVAATSKLVGLACTSATNCLAVGGQDNPPRGVLVPVVNGIPGAPVTVAGAESGLQAIACPSATLCVAVGISAQNVGVVVPIANGIAQAAQAVTGSNALSAVACPTSAICEAVGNDSTGNQGVFVLITNGTVGAATGVAGTAALAGLACPTTSTCLAAGITPAAQGAVVPIVNTAAGAAQSVPGSVFLLDIACPAPTNCTAAGIASGNRGVLVPVTNGTPNPVQAVPGTIGLDRLACPDVTVCLATGESSQTQGVSVLASTPPTAATLSYPTAGQANVDTTQNFAWSSVPNAQAYDLVIGTTVQGRDLMNTGVLAPTTTSIPVPALPTNQALHATLLTEHNNTWTDYSEITFTAAPGEATFTHPVDRQLNIDTTKAFTWSTIPASQATIVAIGTQPDTADVFNSGPLPPSQSSINVPALPGGILYASLLTEVNGAFSRAQRVAFTAASGGARFTHPIDAQSVVNAGPPFTWSTVALAQGYILVVGRTRFGTDLVNSGTLPAGASSYPMPALPTGVTLYACILTKVNGGWVNFQAITFTAH